MASLVNAIYSNSTETPEVGKGVTFLHYSDRSPGTIVSLVHFKSGPKKGQIKGFYVVADEWKITSGSQGDGSAQYDITPTDVTKLNQDPNKYSRPALVTIKVKNGRSKWETQGGGGVAVGFRDVYYDPSF